MGIRKKLSFILFFHIGLTVLGQASGHIGDAHRFDSDFTAAQYRYAFSGSPAMLSHWDLGFWSNIGGGYTNAGGDFRHHQQYQSFGMLQVQTESFFELPESGWTFYGQFLYGNGRADSLHNNLMYHLPANGSPQYVFMQRAGAWRLQQYEFNVVAANQLNDRLSVGARIMYQGGLAFRHNDTRNNQPSLHTDLAVSASYLAGEHIFSAGAEYTRSKTRPRLSNKYPGQAHGAPYNLYINAGLGSYLRTQLANTNLTFEGTSLGGMVQWMLKTGSRQYSALYSGRVGNQHMMQRHRLEQSVENKLLNYDYGRHQIVLSALHPMKRASFLSAVMRIDHLSGENYRWSEERQNYLNNYRVASTAIQLEAAWHRPAALFNKWRVQTGIHAENRFDRTYSYAFEFTNLQAGSDGSFFFPFGDAGLFLGAGVYYQFNLHQRNNPNAAADNIYTEWIAGPTMAYLSTDHIRLPMHIGWQMPRANNLWQFRIEAEQLLPTRINHPEGSPHGTDDRFLTLMASFRLYF